MARPKKPESEKLVEIPCAVPPVDRDFVNNLAWVTHRSSSQVARMLLQRGIAAHKRDGLLDEPASTKSHPKLKMAR